MRIATPAQMRQMDSTTITEIGIPGEILMERAALGATRMLLDKLPHVQHVGILCGGGNNGGDGLAMARLLEAEGIHVTIVLLSNPEGFRAEAALNWKIVQNLELSYHFLFTMTEEQVAHRLETLPHCDLWCDALFGTGLSRPARGRYAVAIDFLNRQPCVLAVDIPSGLDSLTGQPMGSCVRASYCASFGMLKTGQVLLPGRHLCGETQCIDIGIPERVIDQCDIKTIALTASWAKSQIRTRSPMTHKGDAGKLLILAGSNTMSGAAILCARGAIHGGAGLVTVGTYDDVVPRISLGVPEAMSAPLLTQDIYKDRQRLLLQQYLDRAQIIAMGPGMGTQESLRDVLQHILLDPRQDLVLDADALSLIAEHRLLDVLRRASLQRTIVLTPHPGEMAKLTNTSIDEILSDPIEHARTLAQVSQCIVVLKIASTVIASPDGRVAINTSGNPGMASGGMGDVLTGVLAAQLASHPDHFVAACIAVWLHGAAGDLCCEVHGELTTSASLVVDFLGKALVRMG